MPLDAIALGAIAHELNRELAGAKIEKIHQPERDELLLLIKGNSGTRKLAVSASSANARMHIVKESKENPVSPPMFCMLLRKHLSGGKINSITRLGYERVVDIEISCRNEMGDLTVRHLICEVMGRNSNIILLNEEKRILDSVKHVDLTVSSVRNILPGLKYMLPPDSGRQNPDLASVEDFIKIIKNSSEGKPVDRAITDGVMGISPLLAGECVFRACGNRNLYVGELSELQICAISKELFLMFEKARKLEYSPCIVYSAEANKVSDFAPFDIRQYGESMRTVPAESMNSAACEFYFMRDMSARMNDRSAAINKVITNNLKRAEKKLNILQCELKEAENREYFRVCGDLITANLYKMKKGDATLIVRNFYDENAAEIEISLDIKLSPAQNAARYYTKYKKAKNTEIYAKEQIDITVKEIQYLESVLYSVSAARVPQHLEEIREELATYGYVKGDNRKKRKNAASLAGKPYEFEYNGYTIYVGRNNIQNDILTLRMSRSRDLWLHTKNIAGSHTLVKFMGEEFPDDVIETAASIAAFYSKGKNSPYVEVDYCPVSHVKKPNGAKAGMVIYEGYSTALVKPDGELAAKLRK